MNKEQKFAKVRGIVRFSANSAELYEDAGKRRDVFMFCRGLVSMAYDLHYLERTERAALLKYIEIKEKLQNERNEEL